MATMYFLFSLSPFFLLSAITKRKPDSLKHVETVEKNSLPGQEEIEAEKKAMEEKS